MISEPTAARWLEPLRAAASELTEPDLAQLHRFEHTLLRAAGRATRRTRACRTGSAAGICGRSAAASPTRGTWPWPYPPGMAAAGARP